MDKYKTHLSHLLVVSCSLVSVVLCCFPLLIFCDRFRQCGPIPNYLCFYLQQKRKQPTVKLWLSVSWCSRDSTGGTYNANDVSIPFMSPYMPCHWASAHTIRVQEPGKLNRMQPWLITNSTWAVPTITCQNVCHKFTYQTLLSLLHKTFFW